MVHVISVDWFAVYGLQGLPLDARKPVGDAYVSPGSEYADICKAKEERLTEVRARATMSLVRTEYEGGIRLELQQYGTRQFSMLANVYVGRDLFGFLQMLPRTSVFPKNAMIFKVANKFLYSDEWRALLQRVFKTLRIKGLSISRLDIAADFNRFECGLHPIEFIRQFMSGELKHKGRGAGHVDFVQRYAVSRQDNAIKDSLSFNALVMGKKSSDAHCYLYNKTLELEQQHDKPYIRELWQKVGLNSKDVWRLEVTLDRKALIFADKSTGELHKGMYRDLMTEDFDEQITSLYYTFIHSLFFFFRPTGQKNVSREAELPLFGDLCTVERGAVSTKNTSTRSDRIFIKKLYTLANVKGGFDFADLTDTQRLAIKCADVCALNGWLGRRIPIWTMQESGEYRNTRAHAPYSLGEDDLPSIALDSYRMKIAHDAMKRALWDSEEKKREKKCRKEGTPFIYQPFISSYAES